MRRIGLAAFLVLALLVGAVGVVAYNLGVSAGATDTAVEAGAAVVLAPAGISPFAAIIGLFFVILVIGFIARAIAGPHRHMGPGPGYWGKGYWGGHRDWDQETVPEPFRPMLERWHREAHDRGTTTSGSGRASSPPPASAPGAPSSPRGPGGQPAR